MVTAPHLTSARSGVRVNALVLGPIETLQLRALFDSIGEDEKARRFVHYPVGRFGTPDEIACTVAYLASDDAGFVTGAAIPLDGGITQRSPFRPKPRHALSRADCGSSARTPFWRT